MRGFDGDLTVPFHQLRASLKYSLVFWHETKDARQLISRLQQEAKAVATAYSSGKPLRGLRDDFEMHLAMAVALSNDPTLAEVLRAEFSFRPCANGYAYYVGFKEALLALVLDDEKLRKRALSNLSAFNATKCFYFPSKAVILAALDGDLKKLKTSVKAISQKFEGYAKKCGAISGDVLDVGKLDLHWFSPYPDWAFYAQAIRRFGPVPASDTVWMPMEFLNSFAAR